MSIELSIASKKISEWLKIDQELAIRILWHIPEWDELDDNALRHEAREVVSGIV